MKKLLMICLVIVMTACTNISAFASAGGFVSSPSGNPAPELVDGKNASEECEAKIIIVAYGDRDQLSEESRKKIEEAYSMIIGTKSLDTLNSAVANLANGLGVDVSDLAVSDLFDISATDCKGHGDHGHFDITLAAETLENFVCLLHYHNDEWEIIENAEVTNNGEHLEFDVDELSPFAIVVSAEDVSVETTQDTTTMNTTAVIAGIIAAIVVFFIIFLVLKSRKKED